MPIKTCPNSGALQVRLSKEVRAECARSSFGLTLVIAASGPLRKQLQGVIAAGGPVLGVEVIALWRFARDVLSRCGVQEPEEGPLLELLALDFDPVAPLMGSPPTGFSAAVTDLLSAGLCSTNSIAVLKALEQVPAEQWQLGSRFVPALRAVLERSGYGGRAQDEVLRRAAVLVRADARALPHGCAPGNVHVVGFASATGLATDLLRALHERGATVWLEHLDSSALPLPLADSQRHVAAFATQFENVDAATGNAVAAKPELSFFSAPQLGAEADEVALRICALLKDHALALRPERIAVVMRDYDQRCAEVARALDELGIPFHGQQPRGCHTAKDRACIAVATLLEQGETDHPVLRASRAALSSNALQILTAEVRMTRVEWSAWLALAIAEWQQQTSTGSAGGAIVDAALESLGTAQQLLDALPPEFMCSTRTWRAWTAKQLRTQAAGTIGSKGYGVQLLNPARARGLHFEHMFLLGVEAGTWPRTLQPAVVFPAVARAAVRLAGLAALSGDDAFQEDAHLFVQLLHAAKHCTLTWRCADDEGREQAAAPWVVRLMDAPGASEPRRLRLVTRARHEQSLERFGALPPRAAVQLAGLRGDAVAHQRFTAEHFLGEEVAVCRARLRMMFDDPQSALSRDAGQSGADVGVQSLSPWHGLGLETRSSAAQSKLQEAGHAVASAEGTPKGISPTRLEALATCGWKAFLEKRIGLKPTQDAVEQATALGAMAFGLVVHKALELVLKDCKGGAPPAPEAQDWLPQVREALEHVAKEKSSAVMPAWMKSGAWHDGVEKRVVDAVKCALQVLRDCGVTEVWRTETQEHVTVAGVPITFNADALVRGGNGFVFVDWKTGKKLMELGSRPLHLDRGTKLQGAIYAQATVQGESVQGAYGIIHPDADLETGKRLQVVDNAKSGPVLENVISVLQAVMEIHLAPPRVATGKDADGENCRMCEFKRCCVIGDSNQRWLLQDAGDGNDAFAKWWQLTGKSGDSSDADDGSEGGVND
ncbi:MAG: PD-(D/E)XK nuclease family protein [Planctomycetes bacterium]|nr:PD-(D/E)XK nuclease family protein [Planctomycetota bacterium]